MISFEESATEEEKNDLRCTSRRTRSFWRKRRQTRNYSSSSKLPLDASSKLFLCLCKGSSAEDHAKINWHILLINSESNLLEEIRIQLDEYFKENKILDEISEDPMNR